MTLHMLYVSLFKCKYLLDGHARPCLYPTSTHCRVKGPRAKSRIWSPFCTLQWDSSKRPKQDDTCCSEPNCDTAGRSSSYFILQLKSLLYLCTSQSSLSLFLLSSFLTLYLQCARVEFRKSIKRDNWKSFRFVMAKKINFYNYDLSYYISQYARCDWSIQRAVLSCTAR